MLQKLKQPQHLGKIELGVALVALIAALVSISLSALFIKLGERELGSCATAFNRFWITTIVLVPWQQFRATQDQYSFEQLGDQPEQETLYTSWVLWRLLLVGIFLAADLILWAWSLTQTSVANATLLANLTPLYTSLGGWLIWGRRFDRKFLIGMGIAIAGSLALGLNDFQIDPHLLKGDAAALLAALCFSAYLLIVEQLQTKLSDTKILLWSSAIAGFITFLMVLITKGQLFPESWQGWLAVISLAVVCQVLGQGFLLYSIDKLSSGFVAVFLMLDPILAAIGAWAFFSEQLNFSNWISFGVVLLGIYLALSSKFAFKNEDKWIPAPESVINET